MALTLLLLGVTRGQLGVVGTQHLTEPGTLLLLLKSLTIAWGHWSRDLVALKKKLHVYALVASDLA